MTQNLSSPDRLLRLATVPVVAMLAYTGFIGGILAVVLGVVAGILALTALINFCPIYRVLGISSK